MMRFLSLMIVTAALLSAATASAQNKRDEVENAYRQLRQSFQQPSDANPQTVQRERVRSVETWLQRNDWRELPVRELTYLNETLAGPDQIDKKAFSARWTGTIRPPATGVYRFSQLSIPGAEGSFKLWINDQLILDNAAVSEKEDDEAAVQKSKPGTAVALTAGTPVPFKLEYLRAPVVSQPGVMRLPGFPAAVLAWQSDVLEQQVVPTGVFLTPDAKPGLKGEYFADTTFTKQVAVRTDPNVDFLWDVGRVATQRRDSQREIVSQAVTKITTPGFLDTLDDAKDFIQEQLPTLFGTMSASERVAVLQAVSERPDLLQYLTFPQMAAALRWYSTLADSAGAVDLLVKWSKTAPPPQTQPGFAPGRSPGGYLTQNVEPYFRLARLLVGENVEANIEILVANAAHDDGTCNLTLAYVLCCVCRMTDKLKVIAGLTDSHLRGEENEKKPGDVRASWYLAEAFKYETLYGNEFQPGAGIGPVEKGLAVAESADMRFRMTMELAARLVAIDQAGAARSLIMSVRDQYPDEEKQAVMDARLEKGTEVTEYYENLRAKKAEEADTFAVDAYAGELKRRAVSAEQSGDKRNLDRYTRTVQALENRLTEKQKRDRLEEKNPQ